MKALIGLSKGMMSMPMPWQAWLGLLVAVNAAGPIYFFDALEAKIVLGAFLASVAFMTAIFASKGFVRLLGLGHIFWVPMVPWLFARLDQVGPSMREGTSISSKKIHSMVYPRAPLSWRIPIVTEGMYAPRSSQP